MNTNYVSFTPESISAFIGVLLSVIFAYVPKLRTWFAALPSKTKSLIMLGLLVLTSVVVYVLAVYGIIQTYPEANAFTLIQVIFLAIAANQSTYLILPEAGDVVAARQERV
jgi:hypothetical protein